MIRLTKTSTNLEIARKARLMSIEEIARSMDTLDPYDDCVAENRLNLHLTGDMHAVTETHNVPSEAGVCASSNDGVYATYR